MNAEDDRAEPTGRRTTRIVAAFVGLALLATAALGAWWWTHPRVFGDLGDSIVSAPMPVGDAALSTTVVLPKTEGEAETVTIDSAIGLFEKNTADATAAFWICHLGTDEDPIGAVHDPGKHCADMEPLEAGSSFRHGVWPDSDYLFVTITPARAGVAHLARVDLDYERGWGHLHQQGTESIRVDRKIVARGHDQER